ncbi:hypothetical protein PP754_gp003 [Pectobacterium phage Possum]|uniref:Uncharacterized protein n=1 Tax=Pectobacterium phage Possum TaxID=2686301 RepID=A0A7T0LVL5_9CAUD|nr:hypothetical protein PP754_gp003 [Pectobacterium phage Possum]QPL10844.1 hypothetical protein Possum_00003 [Pectobacterium phage Possum]QPL10946.1 hypothetical protein Horatius_00003 [Pectobacterium phage Horatius]
MSTLVLEVKFIDDTQSVDKEFTDLTDLSEWLHGHRESDFDWLTLDDNNNDYVFEGWSDILQYIEENTGPKSSCIALRAFELNLPVVDASTLITPDLSAESRIPVPVETLTFGELEDGAEFYVAMTWAYGSRNKLQKVMEDGEHNAVWCSATHIGELIPDDVRVVRA